MKRSEDFADVMQQYSDIVWRVCALYLHQKADVEDAYQDTFVRYASAKVVFTDEEHRKAWLIRVAANRCKDLLKSSVAKTVPVESMEDMPLPPQEAADAHLAQSDMLDALDALDEKYRVALYLTYYEGYSAAEIGEMLDMPANTVYTNIARGKKQLKEVLENER